MQAIRLRFYVWNCRIKLKVNHISPSLLQFQIIQINGITSGRNSWSAVYKSGLKKLGKGVAMRMSGYVMNRGFVSNFLSGLTMDIYYGFKKLGNQNMKLY